MWLVSGTADISGMRYCRWYSYNTILTTTHDTTNSATSTNDTIINIINLIPNRQYTGTVQCSYGLIVSWSQCVTLVIPVMLCQAPSHVV